MSAQLLKLILAMTAAFSAFSSLKNEEYNYLKEKYAILTIFTLFRIVILAQIF